MNGAIGFPGRRPAVVPAAVLWCVIGAGVLADQSPRADEGHLERPTDARIEGLRSGDRSVPADVTRNGLHSVQVNVAGDGMNIVGDAANEPSLAIDPTDPDRMVIGWRQFDNVASNFRQAGRAHSYDGGQTWTFDGVHQPGIFRSDPVLDYDADGVIYYNSLRSDFTCQYFISFNGGQSWTSGISAFGGDKLWSAIDRTDGPGRGNIYCAWSPAAGCCGNNIFTRSTDGGFNWMTPMSLPNTPLWGTLSVAPSGSLFISGRAVNGVATVLRSDNAQFAGSTPTFPLVRSVSLGGDTAFSGGPNPGGLLGQVWIACEPPGGPRPGNVYLLASVDPPGPDPLDVMFARSTNNGVSWSAPIRINDDPTNNGAWQWFGTMAVAPNGRIDVVWNDTRADSSGLFSELYYASSSDGGQTFTGNVAVSPAFDRSLGYPNQAKLGDYYQVISEDGFANVAYAATFNGEQDVYFLRIPADCNFNGQADDVDIATGASPDCNQNAIPDECDRDCDGNGAADDCELASGAPDCDGNGTIDACDIASGRLADCDANGAPDDCELSAGTATDCNGNMAIDSCEIAAGAADDCDLNGVPDECDAVVLADRIVPPADATACVGSVASFTVSADGATAFQWRFAGNDIPNATENTLVVTDVTAFDEGAYSCLVSFGCVAAESPAGDLRVATDALAMDLLSPSPLTACAGGGSGLVVLVVGVNDSDGVVYQWSRDGVDLVDGGRFAGTRSPQLEISGATTADGGAYTCRAWNDCIAEEEAVSTVGVLEFTNATFTLPPANVCGEAGGTAVFTGEAVAEGSLIFRWYEDGVALADGGRLSGTHTSSLVISDLQTGDNGRGFRLAAAVTNPPCVQLSGVARLIVQAPGGCSDCPTPGDPDGDGDYDLVDLQRFAACFGADATARPECACTNLDAANAAIDLDDWGFLELLIDGPR